MSFRLPNPAAPRRGEAARPFGSSEDYVRGPSITGRALGRRKRARTGLDVTTDTGIRIQLHRDYTGAPHQTALEAGRSAVRGIRAAASPAQAVLEAQLLAAFGRLGGEYWAHPLGISCVSDRPTGLVIWLDSHTILSTGPFPMAIAALESLMPYWDPGSEVFGVPGLRIAGYRDGLHLRSLRDRGGSVTLYGVRGTRWRQILRDRSAALIADGAVPLWTEPGLTPSEIDHLKNFSEVGANRPGIAWFGSGLLRRVNLLYSHTDAYSVHAWVTGTRWSVEFSSARAGGLGHDHFARMLADKVFGLPLEVTHRHCSCPPRQGYRREFFCRIEMRAPGLVGTVDLRFQHEGADPSRHRRTFIDVGASPAWLDRVLPSVGSPWRGEP